MSSRRRKTNKEEIENSSTAKKQKLTEVIKETKKRKNQSKKEISTEDNCSLGLSEEKFSSTDKGLVNNVNSEINSKTRKSKQPLAQRLNNVKSKTKQKETRESEPLNNELIENTKPGSNTETCTLSNVNAIHSSQRDTYLTGLSNHISIPKQKCELKINVPKYSGFTSKNIVHFFQQINFGIKCRYALKQSVKSPVEQLVSDLKVFRVASPFDRRVTALEWHPSRTNILGVGSKGGDIILWDTEHADKDKFVQGIGAAGSCQAMKFWPWDTDKVVSASINGTVTLHDFEHRGQGQILADTMDSHDHWYCSVDVNPSRYMVAAGRNHGVLHLMSSEGRKVFEHKLHKGKITHVEFSPREEWLLCTASVDRTVQLWDIRQMKDKKSVLHVLHHDKPVNSAYFSHTDGCRLLTTDQHDQIRVYQAPSWHLETTIQQPHRFFQHISPFKATWHPLQDLVICGRYPDPSCPGYNVKDRGLELYDAKTGDLIYKLHDPGVDGLCPLNKFNRRGDALATGMGLHIVLWTRKEFVELQQKEMMKQFKSILNGLDPSRPNPDTRPSGSQSRPRPRGKKSNDTDTDDLKKKKTKTKSKTSTNDSDTLKMKLISKTKKKEK